jgi:hypothetical protein
MTRTGKDAEPTDDAETTDDSSARLRDVVETPSDPNAAVYEVRVRGRDVAALDIARTLGEASTSIEVLGTAVSERGHELTTLLAAEIDPVTLGERFGSARAVESLDVEDVTRTVTGERAKRPSDGSRSSRAPSLSELEAAVADEADDDSEEFGYDYRETASPDPDPVDLDELLDAMADPEPGPGVEYLLSELRADHDALARRVERTERLSRLTVEAALSALAERDERIEMFTERVETLDARLEGRERVDGPEPPEADR